MKKNYFLLLLLLCKTVLFSQTFNDFNNGAADGGLWSSAANWSLGVPISTHTVRTANSAVSFVDGNFTIARLQNGNTSTTDRFVNSKDGGVLTIDPNTATLASAIAITNVSASAVKLGIRGRVNINNSAGATVFSRITNANNVDNVLEFEPTSVLTITTPLEIFKAGGATSSNNFFFNGKIEGGANLRLTANTIATFGNSVSNAGYTGELVLQATSSIIVNTADDVVFYDGLKIQVNGNNASTTLNGANVFKSGITVGGTNIFTFNVNKNQSAMTNIIFQGEGTLNMVIDNAVTNISFANNSANPWLTGTVNITGFKNGVIRFGTDNTGLTAQQLTQIQATGITAFALDSEGYLIDAATASVGDFEENTINPIAYPTISSDIINFKEAQNNVKVFDVNGRVILHNTAKNQTGLTVSSLPRGLYFVVFNNKKVEKIIKQ
jgi:hypothetical protein